MWNMEFGDQFWQILPKKDKNRSRGPVLILIEKNLSMYKIVNNRIIFYLIV